MVCNSSTLIPSSCDWNLLGPKWRGRKVLAVLAGAVLLFPKRTNGTSTELLASTPFSSLILPATLTLDKPTNQTESTGHLLCTQPHAK